MQMKEIGKLFLTKRMIQRTKSINRTKALRKKTLKTKMVKKKDKESKKNEKEVKNKVNGNNSAREKSKTVYNLGDSMIKILNAYFLTKKVRHKYLIPVRSFSGGKVSCMVDRVKSTL